MGRLRDAAPVYIYSRFFKGFYNNILVNALDSQLAFFGEMPFAAFSAENIGDIYVCYPAAVYRTLEITSYTEPRRIGIGKYYNTLRFGKSADKGHFFCVLIYAEAVCDDYHGVKYIFQLYFVIFSFNNNSTVQVYYDRSPPFRGKR